MNLNLTSHFFSFFFVRSLTIVWISWVSYNEYNCVKCEYPRRKCILVVNRKYVFAVMAQFREWAFVEFLEKLSKIECILQKTKCIIMFCDNSTRTREYIILMNVVRLCAVIPSFWNVHINYTLFYLLACGWIVYESHGLSELIPRVIVSVLQSLYRESHVRRNTAAKKGTRSARQQNYSSDGFKK